MCTRRKVEGKAQSVAGVSWHPPMFRSCRVTNVDIDAAPTSVTLTYLQETETTCQTCENGTQRDRRRGHFEEMYTIPLSSILQAEALSDSNVLGRHSKAAELSEKQ